MASATRPVGLTVGCRRCTCPCRAHQNCWPLDSAKHSTDYGRTRPTGHYCDRGVLPSEYEHEFVLAAVERPHAAVGFDPDTDVLEFKAGSLAGPAVHPRVASPCSYRLARLAEYAFGYGPVLPSKSGEFLAGHFAGSHGELTVESLAPPRDSMNSEVIRRITDYTGRFLSPAGCRRHPGPRRWQRVPVIT